MSRIGMVLVGLMLAALAAAGWGLYVLWRFGQL